MAASFPFRPPQFSDDSAWLPAWLQSDQSHASLSRLSQGQLHHSIQNVDPLNDDNDKVEDPYVRPSTGSRHNIVHLYLSGEGDTPVTVSPSCEKVLEFNLHLSIDEILSNISQSAMAICQHDGLNSAEGIHVQTDEALHGSQRTVCNMKHDSSCINLFPSPSNEKCSGDFQTDHRRKQCNSTNARQGIVNILNSKCAECDDVNDAVELSVAASEALVIYELVQHGLVSEPVSPAAILEIALRVKQARLDGLNEVTLNDSVCCSKSDSDTTDVLSDLSDSDLEDALKDVGLSINILHGTILRETSVSRVMDTPMSKFHPKEGEEFKCKQHEDQEICFSGNFATKPLEKNLDTKSLDKTLDRRPALNITVGTTSGSQKRESGDLLMIQDDNNDIVNVHQFPHRLEVKSSCLGKDGEELILTTLHSHCDDMDKVNDKSTCRFQSRWFGGWVEKEEVGACRMESKGTKSIPKLFIAETSYLSESADVAPDQNSFVHNHYHCSKASESGIPQGSYDKAGEGGFIDQDGVKDLSIDPLCSIVPCSISADINSAPQTTNNNDGTGVSDAINSKKTDIKMPGFPLEDVKIDCCHLKKDVGRDEQDKVVFDDNGPGFAIWHQLTSLRPYSVGLPGDYTPLPKTTFDRDLASPRENRSRLPLRKQDINSTKSHNDSDLLKSPIDISTSKWASARSNDGNHEMRLLSMGQYISCGNTYHDKVCTDQSPLRSIECSTAINNEMNHATSHRHAQDDFEQNAKNGAEVQVQLQEVQCLPLVMSHKIRRRFRAPKLPVTDLSTDKQVEYQGPGCDMILHKHREVPQVLGESIPDSEVPARKRVRFSDIDIKLHPIREHKKIRPGYKIPSSCRAKDRTDLFNQELGTASQEVKARLTNCHVKGRKRTIFQGLEFLLTGFSKKKEKEIEALLRKHGGMVLSDIPSPPPCRRESRSLTSDAQRLPVILCTKKLQSTKFLYGCAVNASLLKIAWAYDSIKAGSVLLPDKYVIASKETVRNLNQIGQSMLQSNDNYIFDKVGIMLHGRSSFCSKLVKVIKHGRGRMYRSLHWLVQSLESKKIFLGAVITEGENRATRHLKKCAAEQKIPVVPASWIVRSLYEGKLLPFDDNYLQVPHSPSTDTPTASNEQESGQEI